VYTVFVTEEMSARLSYWQYSITNTR